MNEIADRLLDRYQRLGGVDRAVLEELVAPARIKRLEAGEVIAHQGDPCGSMIMVLEGSKRVYRSAETGREITVYEVGPGELCPLVTIACLNGSECLAHAVAMTPMVVAQVPAEHVRAVAGRHPEVMAFLHQHLYNDVALVLELLSEVTFNRMNQRLMAYLAARGERDGGEVRRTHQQIADDLGTAREVISRLLKALEGKGLIELGRNSIRLKARPFPRQLE